MDLQLERINPNLDSAGAGPVLTFPAGTEGKVAEKAVGLTPAGSDPFAGRAPAPTQQSTKAVTARPTLRAAIGISRERTQRAQRF